jgi:C-terminal processing protease CtpA/Prc
MIKTVKNILSFLFLVSLIACDNVFLDGDPKNSPTANFDYLWNDFDKLYGGFNVKNINWDSLYNVYRPQIDDYSTNEELYNVLTGLLGNLNDNHVFLLPDAETNLESFNSGIVGRLKTFNDFKESTIVDYYLAEVKMESENLSYGKLDDNIGYIHINLFDESEKYYESVFDDILDYLEDTDGIIFDIRNHEGGTDQLSVYIAGRFANESKKVFNFRLRNGPSHSDFSETHWYSVKPEGKTQYTKPVVVLTHRFTISAAETFAMTMATLQNVTLVGDTTSGAFSDYVRRELPNGWGYGVAVGEWRDSENQSFEGIGLPPDIVVLNDSADVANGIDEALETAVKIIR